MPCIKIRRLRNVICGTDGELLTCHEVFSTVGEGFLNFLVNRFLYSQPWGLNVKAFRQSRPFFIPSSKSNYHLWLWDTHSLFSFHFLCILLFRLYSEDLDFPFHLLASSGYTSALPIHLQSCFRVCTLVMYCELFLKLSTTSLLLIDL